jgi:hypothetical protein
VVVVLMVEGELPNGLPAWLRAMTPPDWVWSWHPGGWGLAAHGTTLGRILRRPARAPIREGWYFCVYHLDDRRQNVAGKMVGPMTWRKAAFKLVEAVKAQQVEDAVQPRPSVADW